LKNKLLGTCLSLVCSVPWAFAGDAQPTAAQLESAYCVPVLKIMSDQQRQMTAALTASGRNDPASVEILAESKKGQAKVDDLLRQRQKIIGASPPPTADSPIAKAEAQALADEQQYDSNLRRCIQQCTNSPKTRDACTDSCMGEDSKKFLARVQACKIPPTLQQ
jgi:hypothetical protein